MNLKVYIGDLCAMKTSKKTTILYTLVVSFLLPRHMDHEEAICELAKEMGFLHVSLSSQVMPMVRMVPRGYTGIYSIGYTLAA